ncbi:MAG: adenine nucleotide alpha hydrolase family protein [Actinobacteria bacterium]|nr:adenine nucleotide alpha hydrolase family protein [Actinomycetota bacterium]
MSEDNHPPVQQVEGRCRICAARTGVLRLTEFNLKLCPPCYLRFYERRVRRAVEKHDMLQEGDRVVVAVSGGKDSAALLYALRRLGVVMGFHLSALHFHLNMGEYSDRNLGVVEEQCSRAGVLLRVVRIGDMGLRVQKVKGWHPCAVCGAIKRSLLDREARGMDATVVATAHTLEDILLFAFKNLLSRKHYLPPPVLPAAERLVRKVKPLYYMPERLNLEYCHQRDIPVFAEKCPVWSPRGHALKEVFDHMERIIPSGKLQLLLSLREAMPEGETTDREPPSDCTRCGEPTSQPLCAICQLSDWFAHGSASPASR